MNKRVVIFICMSLVFFSCLHKKRDTAQFQIPLPKKEIARPQIISDVSSDKPDTIIITSKSITPAKAPDIQPSKIYQRSKLLQNKTRAAQPIERTPGLNGTPAALTTMVRDTFSMAGIPTIIPAKDAYIPLQNAQSFSFYTRKQGLPHDDISSISADETGNMWMGTYGAGAIRFDGLNFYQYNVAEGLNQNYILSILATSTGDIWMGTRAEGAIRFDGRNFHYYTTDNGLVNNRVETIFEDSKGNIWMGTYGGASMYDGEKLTSYTREHLGANIVYVILEDTTGNIWFGTRGAGISRFDGQTFYNYTLNHGLGCNYIVTGLADSKGDVWFGSYENGAVRFDGSYFYHYTRNEGLNNNNIRSFAEDLNGNIWIGSSMGGLTKINEDIITLYTREHGLINSYITSFSQDEKGLIWFGTYGGGLGVFQGNVFSHFYENHGIADGFVRSIMQDKDDYLWLGTNSTGALRYDGSRFERFDTRQGLSYSRVGGILQDEEGKIWFATTGRGISIFDGKAFTNISEENGLNDEFLIAMTKDSRGNIWFTTRNEGIIKYDGETFLSYTTKHGLSDNNTRSVMEDSKGNIWIGTRAGGVNKFDGDSFTHFTEKGGLISNNILDIIEDRKGNIWIGTNGSGVSKYDGEYFYHYTEREGLINDFVYSLLEDQKGNIWFGTRMGLSKLINDPTGIPDSTSSLKASERAKIPLLFKNYSQNSGFLGTGTNSRAMYEDKEGKIWIGANDILTVYNPANDFSDTIPPDIQLFRVGLFNEDIQWGKLLHHPDTTVTLPNGIVIKDFKFDAISSWYGLPQNLRLAWDNNYITFGFTGISSSFVDELKYSYVLEGFENQWSSLNSRTEASYGNLNPGYYTFRVKAVNKDGYQSEDIAFSFRITPPLWRTWWAYLAYAFLLILIIYFAHKYLKNRALRKELEKQRELYLQHEVSVARQSAEFKQNFLANMSHEIRTPLTGILGMANLLNQLPLDPKAKEYVEDLNKSGETLRETINMILDISKIEAGKLKLKKSSFSLRDILDQSIKLYAPICRENVVMESSLDETIPAYIYSDKQRVSQVIKNFLSNAVKFTETGKIAVHATLEPDLQNTDVFFIKIEVCDTGPGIAPEVQQNLFTPFYQGEQKKYHTIEGTGLGLAICKELAALLGGQTGLESTPGSGSCFWFTFKTQKGSPPDAVKSDTQKHAENIKNKKLQILLVEDKTVIQKVVRLMLSAKGHKVEIAGNGQQALEKYAPGKFDLILMDIQMPVMDGITATLKLREMHRELPPVVGLSANAFEEDRSKFMEQGLDEYLTKPFKEKDFDKVLRKLKLD